MQVLQLNIDHNLYTFCTEADIRRVKAAERAMLSYAKNARKLSIMSRKGNNMANIDDVEGQYSPGKLKINLIFFYLTRNIAKQNFKRVFLVTTFTKLALRGSQKLFIQFT